MGLLAESGVAEPEARSDSLRDPAASPSSLKTNKIEEKQGTGQVEKGREILD